MAITMKMARVNANKTMKEIADEMGMIDQTYSKYERNPELLSIRDAKKFCEITGYNIDDIFFHTGSN